MTPNERICTLLLDKISIKPFLTYNPQQDLVEEFEDFGHFGRTNTASNSALGFMVRGLLSKWKQPLAYVLSKGPVKTNTLLSLIKETLQKLVELGLQPKMIICDQGSNNRALFKRLGISIDSPFFDFDNIRVYGMFDPPHLIKSIRNNLYSNGFRVGDAKMCWSYISRLYEIESKPPIRLCPKLTQRHIVLKNFSKLSVNLAVHILSHSVAAGIATMVNLSALPPEAMATAHFAEKFDQLFNCFNSKAFHSKQVMGHAISVNSEHLRFLNETQEWLNTVRANNQSGSIPCLEGWKLSISCPKMLWDDVRENYGFRYLLTDRLNQDCWRTSSLSLEAKEGTDSIQVLRGSEQPYAKQWSTPCLSKAKAKIARGTSTLFFSAWTKCHLWVLTQQWIHG
ncbi:transposable element p transposase [Plakobranchus ocellatus]|uniref:Transposable element p transposase n=1 Tax=Plakobranchus ocellatus TaxID=259542 RepID=A0AAV4A2E2_9GAST|nr:transposable element p transposase [Plakobranchus ocellatus]